MYIVFGPAEYYGSDTAVEEYDELRPVNNDEEYISNEVAFAYYDGCGHNIFSEYYQGFYPPFLCPVCETGFRDEDSVNLP